MGDVLRIFISATRADLGSLRRHTRDFLNSRPDYKAIEQEHFLPSAQTLLEESRHRLAECDAVIHIVGECYGHEPNPSSSTTRRRSYTQMEYDYARYLGRPIYLFVCDDHFPYTAHDPEPEEEQALQRAHREAILNGEYRYEYISDVSGFDSRLHALSIGLTRLRTPAILNGGNAPAYYSCFISYSEADSQFATRLYEKMRAKGLKVWFAPEDMRAGQKLHEQIEAAIRGNDKLLVVLSEASMQSAWVQDELRKAFREESDSERAGRTKQKLFPVRLCDYATLQNWVCRDSRSGFDLADEVRQYFIPDFSRWKEHDQFEASFARLLKDLKAGE